MWLQGVDDAIAVLKGCYEGGKAHYGEQTVSNIPYLIGQIEWLKVKCDWCDKKARYSNVGMHPSVKVKVKGYACDKHLSKLK